MYSYTNKSLYKTIWYLDGEGLLNIKLGKKMQGERRGLGCQSPRILQKSEQG